MPEAWSIGADIGYTNTRVAKVIDGIPVRVLRFKTDVPGGPPGILRQVADAVEELRSGEPSSPTGLGIGIAGQCDVTRGVVRCGPNLWWKDEPFQAMMAEAISLPVVLRNDVVMATIGEWRHGAGQGADDLVCLFVGTGIGGGAVVEGSLINGASGCAGHFGHVSVQMDGPICTCGRPGCVEAYASGWAVARIAQEALMKDAATSEMLHAMCGGRPERIDCRMVADAAHRGDAYSLKVRDSMAAALSSGVASVINSFNPRKVVLGGTVLNGFPSLFDMVASGAKKLALRSALDDLEICRAALGDVAGAVGAAIMALRNEDGD